MGFPFCVVAYSGAELNNVSNPGGATYISGIQNFECSNGLKTRIGTASFQIQNMNNGWTSTTTGSGLRFHIDDCVNVWLGYNNLGSAVIFPGYVNEITQTSATNSQLIKVSMVDKVERMLSMMDAKDYGTGSTASQILIDIITRINGYRKTGEPAIGTGSIQSTNITITYAYNYKTVTDILKELSVKEKTGNGQYIYYIDTANNLVYKPRPSTTSLSVHEYQFTKFDAVFGVFDVVNAVIVNCGKDNDGKTVLAMGVNYTSVTDIGFRWKYYVNNTTDIYKNQTTTTQRTLARAAGGAWANDLTRELGYARWRITATYKGSLYYPGTTTLLIPGDVLTVTSPSNWVGTKNLRLQDIKHNYSTKGWITTLTIEQDDITIELP